MVKTKKLRKRLSNPPHNRYEGRSSDFKFKAEIFEGGYGWFEMVKMGRGGGQVECEESATLEDWIDNIENRIWDLSLLLDFLKEVRCEEKDLLNNYD